MFLKKESFYSKGCDTPYSEIFIYLFIFYHCMKSVVTMNLCRAHPTVFVGRARPCRAGMAFSITRNAAPHCRNSKTIGLV